LELKGTRLGREERGCGKGTLDTQGGSGTGIARSPEKKGFFFT